MGTFRQEYVRCGKSTCKTCPHGPYWYEYWREGARVRKRYVGRTRPGGQAAEPRVAVLKEWEAINCKRTASMGLACRILGIDVTQEKRVAYSLWAKIAMQHHPDRGGDEALFKLYNAAWSYYRASRGW